MDDKGHLGKAITELNRQHPNSKNFVDLSTPQAMQCKKAPSPIRQKPTGGVGKAHDPAG